MHEVYEALRSKLSASLKELNKTNRLSGAALSELHTITDTLKNLDKIEMLEDEGYSSATNFMGASRMYGRSYARGDYGDDRSGANRQGSTYVHGYYRGGRDGRRGYSRDGYSYGGGKDEMIEQLEEMMENADGSHRDAIRRCLDEVKKS